MTVKKRYPQAYLRLILIGDIIAGMKKYSVQKKKCFITRARAGKKSIFPLQFRKITP